jgi:hypothetical protein
LHFYDHHLTQIEVRTSFHNATIDGCKHLISTIKWLDLKAMVTEWRQSSSHWQLVFLIPFLSFLNH